MLESNNCTSNLLNTTSCIFLFQKIVILNIPKCMFLLLRGNTYYYHLQFYYVSL